MDIKIHPTTKFNEKQAAVYEKLVEYVREYEQKRSECQTPEDKRDFDNVVAAMENEMRLAEYAIINSKTHEIMSARFATLLHTNEYCYSVIFEHALSAISEVYDVW